MSAEPSAVTPACQPYPGLRPFLADEAHLYFGREKHRTELLKRLSATRFVAVVGTSGSGKSSLVQAGLLPDLLSGYLPGAGCDWAIVTTKPGSDPLGRLASAFSREGWTTDAADLRTNSSAVLDLAGRQLADDQHLLVLVDQFEELFRLKVSEDSLRDADEKAAFVRLLLTAGGQRADGASHTRVHVLIAMRSEFLGRASVYRGLPEAIDQGQYLIPRLTREQLRRAIECPARVCGGEVDERLVQQLLNELGDDQDHLPVLQHALMRCWEFRGDHNRIGADAYKACGGLAGALSMDANGALDDVRCTLADRGAFIVQRVFQALRETDVNGGQTRRPTPVSDLCEMAGCTEDELTVAVEPFRRRSFVLPPLPVPLEPATLLDVSHEALLRGWDRLTKWIAEDEVDRQRYLRIATRAADELGSEHPDYLAPPVLPLLVKFWQDRQPPRAWAIRHHPGYDAAKTFLDDSARHQQDIERRQADDRAREAEARAREVQQEEALGREIAKRKRTKRTMWISLAGASLVILTLFNAYLFLQGQAERLEAAVLAAKVPSVPDANLHVRLQLATEAARRLPDPEQQGALLRALWLTPIPLDAGRLSALGDPRDVSTLVVSPSDRWVFAVTRDRLKALDLASGLVTLDVGLGDAPGGSADPDPEPLLLASDDHALVMYDGMVYIGARSEGTVRRLPLEDAFAFTLSANGKTAAFLLPGEVVQCNLSTSCQTLVRHDIQLDARDVALSGDGSVLAITGSQLAVFDTDPWRQRAIRTMDAGLDELAVTVDAEHTHVCASDGLQEFDVYDDSLDSRVVRTFPSAAHACGFSPGGTITAHGDGAVRAWSREGALVSAVSAQVDGARTLALGASSLVFVDGGQLRLLQLAPYGRVTDAPIAGFVRSGAYARVSDPARRTLDGDSGDYLLELDTGRADPQGLPEFTGAVAVSDSLALAAAYVMTPARVVEGVALLALRPGGTAIERWRHNLSTSGKRGPVSRSGRAIRERPTVDFSGDDRYVAIRSGSTTTILDTASGDVVRTLEDRSVALFVGDEVLAAGERGVVAVSLTNGTERPMPDLMTDSMNPAQAGRPLIAAVSANAGRIAVAQMGGQTSAVHVFAWPTLEAIARLSHAAAVASLAFNGGGEHLIVSTDDGATHVWDVMRGRETVAIPPPGSETSADKMAVFTPSGRIAIATDSGVSVLPADTAEWRNEACRRLEKNLTPEEWRVFVGNQVPYVKTCPDRP